jgi:hypothetical protein
MCASISFRYAKIGIFFEKEKMRKRENEILFENE